MKVTLQKLTFPSKQKERAGEGGESKRRGGGGVDERE